MCKPVFLFFDVRNQVFELFGVRSHRFELLAVRTRVFEFCVGAKSVRLNCCPHRRLPNQGGLGVFVGADFVAAVGDVSFRLSADVGAIVICFVGAAVGVDARSVACGGRWSVTNPSVTLDTASSITPQG